MRSLNVGCMGFRGSQKNLFKMLGYNPNVTRYRKMSLNFPLHLIILVFDCF